VAVAAITLIGLAVPFGAVPGVQSAVAAAPVLVESADFASEVYADPWDFSNVEDQNTDEARTQGISVSGGRLQLDLRPGDFYSPVISTAGSLPYGRDAVTKRVDTNRYTRLSFRMDQPTKGTGAFYWFTCREQLNSCATGISFDLVPGDHVYDLKFEGVPLASAKIPWRGSTIYGLRMLPIVTAASSATTHVSIDWMRLYAPGAANAYLPPGDYANYSIEALPRPVVDSPGPDDGQDLASAQRGRPWDLTSAINATGIDTRNVEVRGYGPLGMTGTNTGPGRNDPEVLFPVQPFDANRFHNLSFEMTYDGGYSLEDRDGGGKMARLIWLVNGADNWQESDDLLTYSGPNARKIEVDLTAGSPLDADSTAPRLGWAGQTVRFLRFDPNEDRGAATWHLKNLHVRADPAAVEQTTVKFRDTAWMPGTTADVKVGRGTPGTPYETIASGVPVVQGSNSVPFSLDGREAGAYRVQVDIHHPAGGSALAFSRSAITMTHDATRNPKGAFDVAQRTPGGVIVDGWLTDPDSSSPTEVRFYDNRSGRYLGNALGDRARPDVQRNIPGAPAATGFRTTLSVGAGSYDVCAYGINTGRGVNALIGCRPVTVSGTPIGALDAAVRIPGGIRASGWSLDPDIAGSIPVHVYAGSTGRATTAATDRSDIARAYPEYGGRHGYSVDVPASGNGPVNVCAYGLDDAGKVNPQLGCRSVVVDGRPVGAFDTAVRTSTDRVSVSGWALDPDTAASIEVHVYVAQRGAALRAADARSDIARIYPAWGAQHGFSGSITATPGSKVCAYAIDTTGMDNTLLGCRAV
jgi:hypothetical protein